MFWGGQGVLPPFHRRWFVLRNPLKAVHVLDGAGEEEKDTTGIMGSEEIRTYSPFCYGVLDIVKQIGESRTGRRGTGGRWRGGRGRWVRGRGCWRRG